MPDYEPYFHEHDILSNQIPRSTHFVNVKGDDVKREDDVLYLLGNVLFSWSVKTSSSRYLKLSWVGPL